MLLTAYRTKLLLARTILTPLIICCQEQLCVEEEPRTKAQQEEQEAFLRAIGDEEDIKTLVQGMAKYPSDPAIQEGACGRLGELAIKTGKDKEIANLGGIQAILNAMKKHGAKAKVQEKACNALYILSFYEKQVKIANLGGIEALLKAMKDHATEAEVQKNACAALLNLGADNQAHIKRQGGEEAVRRAMSAPNATPDTKGLGQMLLHELAQC